MNIGAMRKRRKITQAELAERMGVSQASISQWESGDALPTADKLPLLAKVLGCTIDELYEKG